jgi:hypothetical protein
MRKISWWGYFPLIALLLAHAPAHAGEVRPYGDDDPIPWGCVNFSGQWKSDNGREVVIDQKKCSWIKMKGTIGLQDGAVVIVPDDKVRTFAEDSYRGVVRYRWNSREYGSVLETSRAICYNNRTVEEYVTLEQVSDKLLLETTYRTTTYFSSGAKPHRDV